MGIRSWGVVVVVLFACSPTSPPTSPPTDVQRSADTTTTVSYRKGVRIEHWLAHVAPIYEGRSHIAHTFAAAWFDDEDLRWIAAHGFDHIVVPTSAEEIFDVEGAPVAAAFAPLDRTIAAANTLGLGVVIELVGSPPRRGVAPRYDPDEDFDPDDAAALRRRTEAWRRLAQHYRDVGDGLRFAHAETLPPSSPDPNQRLQGYVAAIHDATPTRFVYVAAPIRPRRADEAEFLFAPPGASTEHLGALDLDALGPHVGVKFTYYEPEAFVFQDPRHGAVPFPGVVPNDIEGIAPSLRGTTMDVASIDAAFARVATWRAAEATTHEVYLGDFGMTEGVDPEATVRYLQAVTAAAARHGFGWAIYDYESGRAVRGEDGGPTAIYDGLGLEHAIGPVDPDHAAP